MRPAWCVLPEPVGPVTRNSPRGRMIRSLQHRRRAKLLEVQQLVGNLPQHHAHVALLLEDRNAEPGQVAEGEAEVGAADLLQLLLAPLRRDALHQRHGVVRLEDLGFQPLQVAVQPHDRRLADGDVQVAGLAVNDRLQQFVD